MGSRNESVPARRAVIAAVTLALLASVFVVVASKESQAAPLHGLTFLKGCASPTLVGQQTQCNFTVSNSIDLDTLTITSIVDTVHGANGDDVSGNILPDLDLTFSGGAFCNGTQTLCTLPTGSSLTTATPFAFHTVTAADFANANPLTDNAVLTWQDTCSSQADNCPTGNQTATTGSQTTLQKLPSSTTTTIHNAAHQEVLAVEAGTTVHDFVSVTGGPGNPIPSGNVVVRWFTNNTCTGSPQSSSGPVALSANGTADVTSFSKTPGAGRFAFQAQYNGSGAYLGSVGPCEPLTVVDASIKITPDATNEVGDSHTFTVTARINDGTGFQPAAGIPIDYTLTDSNGATQTTSPNPPTTCDGTTNGNGVCKIVFVSPTAGKVTGNASMTVTLAGISVTRSTSGNAGPNGSGPAVKTYVDASIGITPDGVNEVGDNHTFTVVVKQNSGNGNGFVNVPNGTKPTVTLTNSNGAVAVPGTNTCATTGTVAGECTITFTSNTAGRVRGNASVTLDVGGVSLTRDTNPATGGIPSGPGGTGPAVKDFVDANITITPDGTNPVNVNHTFTVTVKRNLGTGGGFVNVPDGTNPVVTLVDTNGATHTTSDDNCATTGTVNGQCSVTFTSPTAGTTTGNAAVTLTIRGVTVTRDTDPSSPATAGPGGSGPAVKNWVENNACPSVTKTIHDNGDGTLTVVFDQDTNTNDNSYGDNAIGWNNHDFKHLVQSDHAVFEFVAPDGDTVVLSFGLDYLTQGIRQGGSQTTSTYDSLGPFGGDGFLDTGNPAWVLDWDTSLSDNLNAPGVFNLSHQQVLAPAGSGPFGVNILEDSPETENSESYVIPAASPWNGRWNFRNVYTAVISQDAFPDPDGAGPLGAGFVAGGYTAGVTFVHNSPEKSCPTTADFSIAPGLSSVNSKTVTVPLKSNSTNPATLSKITMDWPTGNGNLLSVKLGGTTIYNTSTAPPSTTIASFIGGADRTIGATSTENLVLTFANDAALATYSIDLEFGAGNLVHVDIPDVVVI